MGEPAKKFRADADFLRPVVAIVDDDFANAAEGVLMDEIVGGAIAAVPRGLVIHDDLNVTLLSGGLNGAGVFHADRERFFHHHGHAVAGAGSNRLAMIAGVAVHQRCLRMSALKHFVGAGEKQFGIHTVFLCVIGRELLIAFGDADELDVGTMQALLKEAFYVSVDQADDYDFEGSDRLRRLRDASGDKAKARDDETGKDAGHMFSSVESKKS